MQLIAKLGILADAAKYDASCASSGAPKRGSRGRDGLGATDGMGICHSYTPDGRCVSLLKVLLTNFCLYDCQYCVNRRSSNVPRALQPRGSGAPDPGFLPAQLHQRAVPQLRHHPLGGLHHGAADPRGRLLREEHNFRGYIHLKTIPMPTRC
jgi:predicted DNA-binding helix-hairpin-helix protein